MGDFRTYLRGAVVLLLANELLLGLVINFKNGPFGPGAGPGALPPPASQGAAPRGGRRRPPLVRPPFARRRGARSALYPRSFPNTGQMSRGPPSF